MEFNKTGLLYKAQLDSFKGFTDIMCQFMEGPVKRDRHQDCEPSRGFYPYKANYLLVERPSDSNSCIIHLQYSENKNSEDTDNLEGVTVKINLNDGSIEVQNNDINRDIDKVKLDTVGDWLEFKIAKLRKGIYCSKCKYYDNYYFFCSFYQGYTVPSKTEWSMSDNNTENDEEEWNEEKKYLISDIEYFGIHYLVNLPLLKGFTDLYCQLNEKSCGELYEYIEPRKELYPENANYVRAFVKDRNNYTGEVVKELKGSYGIIVNYIDDEDNRKDFTVRLTIFLSNGNVQIENISDEYRIHREILISIREWLNTLAGLPKGIYCTDCKYIDKVNKYCKLYNGHINLRKWEM